MAEQQEAAGVPKSRRAELRVLNAPRPAVLVEPRKRTLPVVVFLSVMIASIALAFVLENTSRRRRLVGAAELHDAAEPDEVVEPIRRRF